MRVAGAAQPFVRRKISDPHLGMERRHRKAIAMVLESRSTFATTKLEAFALGLLAEHTLCWPFGASRCADAVPVWIRPQERRPAKWRTGWASARTSPTAPSGRYRHGSVRGRPAIGVD